MATPLRVLMLEDRQDDSRLVLHELHQAGFVVQVDHVQTETDFFARLEPAPDLILADCVLPQFDALQALRGLLQRGLDIPFIIVSGSIGEDTAVQALQEGAADYLLKDRLGRLGQAVAQALEKKRLRSAQRQVEQALRESEERFRNAFDHTHVAMVLTDLNHRFVRVNSAFAQLFGYSPEEILQLSMADITHPDDLAESYSRREPLLAGEVPYFQMEKRYLHKDGAILWCLTNVSLIRDNHGRPQQYVGQVQDITKRKHAEEALRRNEERYRSLFENNPLPLWVYDVETLGFLAVNEAAVRHYGYSRDDFLGMTILDIRPPGEIPALHEHLARGAAEFGDRKIWRHRKKNGSVIDVEIASYEFSFEGRKARLVLANDVTERLRSEVVRQRLTAILEATPDLVAISHVDGPITYINTAGRALLGLGPKETVQLSNCRPEETRKMIQQEAIPTAIREGVWSGETVMMSRTGQEIVLSQVIIAHKTAYGTVEALSTIARDISEQKRLEGRFRQAQKMEAIGRLAGAVAHDFNNLLTIINGYCDLVLADLPAGDPLRNYLHEIRAAGDRAAGLTRQLLTFSRRQIVTPAVLNLNVILAELEKMLRRLIGENIDLVIRPQQAIWRIKADPGQIEQVVLNLVVNARDAMLHGGKLTIETKNVELDQNDVAVRPDANPGRYVLLAVSDTGCGMDQATQARIFEPFFTTKELGKGTGLGLATVYGIVKQSGGHIAVFSEVGTGSTFKVFFPRDDDTVSAILPPSIRHEPARGNETILVAEDEEGVRGLARLVLQHHGYSVLEAANGGEALLICEQHQGQIHLLITDVAMPHMSGRQLSERLSLLRPGLKVLFVSGYTDEAIVQNGAFDLGTPFLHKPFSPETLARKVREVIDS